MCANAFDDANRDGGDDDDDVGRWKQCATTITFSDQMIRVWESVIAVVVMFNQNVRRGWTCTHAVWCNIGLHGKVRH